jgi:hypothetical protein
MAYIAGNAIYIRLVQYLKDELAVTKVCGGGVLVKNNTFSNNIGLKKTNGGAISVVCSLKDEDGLLKQSSATTAYDLTPPDKRRYKHRFPTDPES